MIVLVHVLVNVHDPRIIIRTATARVHGAFPNPEPYILRSGVRARVRSRILAITPEPMAYFNLACGQWYKRTSSERARVTHQSVRRPSRAFAGISDGFPCE